MPNFKFKDLFVSLEGASVATLQCPVELGNGVNIIVQGTAACCGGGASLPPVPIVVIPIFTGSDPFSGAFGLKEYLKATLERMENPEKAGRESQLPQTVEEIDMLEKKLAGALEELRTRKADLQQKSS
jgi:hypothetical protein